MSHLPRNKKELANLRMDGDLKLDNLSLNQKQTNTSLATLNEVVGHWSLDVEKQQIKINY